MHIFEPVESRNPGTIPKHLAKTLKTIIAKPIATKITATEAALALRAGHCNNEYLGILCAGERFSKQQKILGFST
eukprot:5203368-Karenia_brevis.AAC.1